MGRAQTSSHGRLLLVTVACSLNWAAARLLLIERTGADAGDCQSNACQSLGYALQQAATGDTLQFGPGIHNAAGNGNLDLGEFGKADLTIQGAGRDVTTVDLGGARAGMRLTAAAGAARLQDFTLQNGNCQTLLGPYGAGLTLENSTAEVRRMAFQAMSCSRNPDTARVQGAREFSGAALHLMNSAALLEDLVVSDCESDVGGGVSVWGNDTSRFFRCTFAYNRASEEGGSLHVAGTARTEFFGCTFMQGTSPLGGHLSDAGTARPVFQECEFTNGYASYHGGHHYGTADAQFRDCTFTHGRAGSSAGGSYFSGEALPRFDNVTFENHSAVAGNGCLRFLTSSRGQVVINRGRFFRNRADPGINTGAIGAPNSLILTDCLFEENVGRSGAAVVVSAESQFKSVFTRVRFVRNRGQEGGGLKTSNWNSLGNSKMAEVICDECVFEDNEVTGNGGAVLAEGSVHITFKRSTFLRNTAGGSGGAIYTENRALQTKIEIQNSTLVENSAASDGGAIGCIDPLESSETRLCLRDSTIARSRSGANGGAIFSRCRRMLMSNASVVGNEADRSGGAMFFGNEVVCTGGPLFQDVVLHDNYAAQTGGALYFEAVPPVCAINQTRNGGTEGPWFWSDFGASVQNNSATHGQLQGSSPVRLSTTCPLQNSSSTNTDCETLGMGAHISTYFGIPFGLEVALTDAFGQSVADPGLIVDLLPVKQDQNWQLSGISRYRFEGGDTSFKDLRILLSSRFMTRVVLVQLRLRLPPSFSELSHIPMVDVNVTLGKGDRECPHGWYLTASNSQGMQTCSPCQGGTYERLGQCRPCRVGTYASEAGSTECLDCPVGHGCPGGTVNPAACDYGSFQDKEGKSKCMSCKVGQYQPTRGNISCLKCPEPRLTRQETSIDITDCVCPEGTWQQGNGHCVECSDAASCDMDSRAPMQRVGFYLLAKPSGSELTYEAYRCLKGHCPYGPAGACHTGREGFACVNCQRNHYECSDNACCPCKDADIWPFLLGVLGVLAVLGVLIFFSRTDASSQRLSTLTVVSTAGQTILLLQLLSLLDGLQIPWGVPLHELMRFISLFHFDLQLFRLQCAVRARSLVSLYVIKLSMLPALLLVLLIIFAAFACVGRGRTKEDIVNCLGTLLMLCFLPVTITSLEPFMCMANPSGSSTVRSMPSVLCGKGEHVSLITAGATAFLFFTVFIIVGVALLCKFYPWLVARANGPQIVKCLRFVFQRFKPHNHRYAFVHLLRSLSYSLVPVVVVDSSSMQLLLLGILAACFGSVQCWTKPWRNWLANTTDAVQNLAFQLLLLSAAGSLDSNIGQVQEEIAMLCTVGLSLVLTFMVGGCVWSAIRRSATRAKPYAAFLSHHKAGAACLARLMKTIINQATGLDVFLDSDDLANLDTLFETVQSDVANVIVILTEDTLRRPWCAGEVVTAYKSKVPLHSLTFEGSKKLSRSTLAGTFAMWTEEDRSHLTAMGVTFEDMKEAYLCLAAVPAVVLPSTFQRASQLEVLMSATDTLIRRCHLDVTAAGSLEAALDYDGGSQAAVIMLADIDGSEALAAAGFLRNRLSRCMPWRVSLASSVEDIKQHKATEEATLHGGLVVLLARQCFYSTQFVSTYIAARQKWPNISVITVLVDPHFEFPSASQLDEKAVPSVSLGMGIRPGKVRPEVHRLLQVLAMPLSLHLSAATLKTEVLNISRRLQVLQDQRKSGSASKRSDGAQSPASPRKGGGGGGGGGGGQWSWSDLVSARASSELVSPRGSSGGGSCGSDMEEPDSPPDQLQEDHERILTMTALQLQSQRSGAETCPNVISAEAAEERTESSWGRTIRKESL